MLCSRGRQQFTRTVLILIRDMNETGVTVGGGVGERIPEIRVKCNGCADSVPTA